jgi:hypothetical protein
VSSAAPAAVETRDRLAATLCEGESAVKWTADALTPRSGSPGGIDDLVNDGVFSDLEPDRPMILVGHEGRLSNLLTELTGVRARPFEHGSAACVSSTTLENAIRGNGSVVFRFPNVDHQEDKLRPKAQSKMAVATFFAGFVFVALIEILLANPSSGSKRFAEAVLSGSLALFIVSIYIYDELSMPEGFWTDGPRSWLQRQISEVREQRRETRWNRISTKHDETRADEDAADLVNDGPVFLVMVATSRYVFTPAVLLALLGFFGIVVSTGSTFVKIAAAVAVIVAAVLYRVRRPPLGPD